MTDAADRLRSALRRPGKVEWRSGAIDRVAAASTSADDRVRLLRRHGAEVGSQVRILPGFRVWSPEQLTLGSCVFINLDVLITNGLAPLVVADHVSIGARCCIATTDHEIGPAKHRAGQNSPGPVSIGLGAWLGSAVTVLPGVTIAAGCVIGAGALVTRSTEPDGLYLGVPARRVRTLP